jgi:hypothetical protein
MPNPQDPCAGKSGVDLANCIASVYGSQGLIPPDQVKAKSGQQIAQDIQNSELGQLVDAFNTLTSPSSWVRIGLFMLALVFVIVGFMVISSGGEVKQ